MKRKLISTLTMLSICFVTFAQHDIGIKIDGGLSRMSNSLESSNSTNFTTTVQFAPSGNLGFYYNFHIGKKSILGAELQFLQINGKDKLVWNIADTNGNNIGKITNDEYQYISYFGIPVYYEYKINKFTINIGVQILFVIESSGKEKGQSTINGRDTSWVNKYSGLNIKSFDFGPRLGLNFDLPNNFSIEGNYYYGINNILNINSSNIFKWKIQQFTIGLRYKFVSINGKKSDNGNK